MFCWKAKFDLSKCPACLLLTLHLQVCSHKCTLSISPFWFLGIIMNFNVTRGSEGPMIPAGVQKPTQVTTVDICTWFTTSRKPSGHKSVFSDPNLQICFLCSRIESSPAVKSNLEHLGQGSVYTIHDTLLGLIMLLMSPWRSVLTKHSSGVFVQDVSHHLGPFLTMHYFRAMSFNHYVKSGPT